MTPRDISKDKVRITERIDKILWTFPHASPKEVARILTKQLYPSEPMTKHLKEIYNKYKNMISVRKCHLKKWLGTKVKGRLPKPLISAHRSEWKLERGVPMDKLLKIREMAARNKPRLEDPRPKGEWYVIPNRNRQCEYHDEHVTVRVMPKSGTCRILPVEDMDFADLSTYVWDAFFKADLSMKECDELLRLLMPHTRHRTFRIGPVTPFKIDFYKDSLGLVFKADGSHPFHAESEESWPTWIQPQLAAINKLTEGVEKYGEHLKTHTSVLRNIDKSTKHLAKVTEKLAEIMGKKVRRKKKVRKKKDMPNYTAKLWTV